MTRPISSLADLTPDPRNARRHTPRNVGMIRDALGDVGAARSIVVDEDGVILAGNATVEAAADAGMSKVQVVDADGETIIAVRRTGLTPQQKARLALYDNRTAELADGWERDILNALQNDGVDLSNLWSSGELTGLLNTDIDNPTEHWRGMPEFQQDDLTAWKQLTVNFKCQDDYEAFGKLIQQTLTEKTRSIWYPPAEIGRYSDKVYVSKPEP